MRLPFVKPGDADKRVLLARGVGGLEGEAAAAVQEVRKSDSQTAAAAEADGQEEGNIEISAN